MLLWMLWLLRDKVLLGKLLRWGMLLYERRPAIELILLCCILRRTEAGSKSLRVDLQLGWVCQPHLLALRMLHVWL